MSQRVVEAVKTQQDKFWMMLCYYFLGSMMRQEIVDYLDQFGTTHFGLKMSDDGFGTRPRQATHHFAKENNNVGSSLAAPVFGK